LINNRMLHFLKQTKIYKKQDSSCFCCSYEGSMFWTDATPSSFKTALQLNKKTTPNPKCWERFPTFKRQSVGVEA